MDHGEPSDWELLAAGDTRDAFATLFDRHYAYVFRVARALVLVEDTAEDVAQEVFIRAFRNRRKWKANAAFRTLLYQVAVNVSREIMRKRGREESKVARWLRDPTRLDAREEPSTEPEVALPELLATLPGRQREVVVLRYLERRSVKETASILGCREGTVKAHLHRAMNAMRGRLGVAT